jgi:hypothetical protein
LQGENAWIFVSEDAIADTIKHYFKFEEDLFTEAKKVAPKNAEVKKPTEVSVVVMDGKLLSAKDVSTRQWEAQLQQVQGRQHRFRSVEQLAQRAASSWWHKVMMHSSTWHLAIDIAIA